MNSFNNQLQIKDAFKILFGPLFQYNNETLKYIKPSGLKSAYRQIVKTCHPDRANIIGISEIELTARFKELNEAYNLLSGLLINNVNSIKYSKNIKTPKKEKPEPDYKYKNNKQNTKSDFFYSGEIPDRKLRFGEYLFYKKLISWNTLINSLVWQYKKRPRIGEICIINNILEFEDIIEILKTVKYNEKFGNAAVRKGFISKYQLKSMLKKQSGYNLPIGKYFINNNTFTIRELTLLLIDLTKHNYHIKRKNNNL